MRELEYLDLDSISVTKILQTILVLSVQTGTCSVIDFSKPMC